MTSIWAGRAPVRTMIDLSLSIQSLEDSVKTLLLVRKEQVKKGELDEREICALNVGILVLVLLGVLLAELDGAVLEQLRVVRLGEEEEDEDESDCGPDSDPQVHVAPAEGRVHDRKSTENRSKLKEGERQHCWRDIL